MFEDRLRPADRDQRNREGRGNVKNIDGVHLAATLHPSYWGVLRRLLESRALDTPSATHVEPPGAPATPPRSHTVQLRATIPISLDAWLRAQAATLGVDKSALTRMLLLQARRDAEANS